MFLFCNCCIRYFRNTCIKNVVENKEKKDFKWQDCLYNLYEKNFHICVNTMLVLTHSSIGTCSTLWAQQQVWTQYSIYGIFFAVQIKICILSK